MRTMALLYGLLSYTIFFATFLYAMAWVGNLGVPNALDSEPTGGFLVSVAINLSLLTLFAVQHSLMARPVFKEAIKAWIPQPVERSTYVLASSLAMILIFACWQPLGGALWTVTAPSAVIGLYALFFVGWGLVLYATCLISHLDLFGVRQVWLYFRRKEYQPLEFRMPSVYKYVRHPLYVGWLIAFWATPTMTGSHFMFAMITTAYILIAIQLEERDLEQTHGVSYTQYKNEVPMLIPSFTPLPEGSEVSA